MGIRLGINGAGRVGRLAIRIALEEPDIQIVAVNNRSGPETLAHLIKYDTVHRSFSGQVSHTEESITANGCTFKVLSVQDPIDLPWHALGVDIVLETTGRFTKVNDAARHLEAGAGKVIISAPAKGGGVPTVVLGVNDETLRPSDRIVSAASCTTNCLAPLAMVLNDAFGLVSGFMTTIHAVTGDQNLVDASHSDLRRARSAAFSIVPTTTGAAAAIGNVIPALKGKLDGAAIRVPTPDGSLVDLVATVEKPVSVDTVNDAFRQALTGSLRGRLEYCEDPIVSADVIGNPHSCVYDAGLTSVSETGLVRICGWYDNEWSYSMRCIELVKRLARMSNASPKPPARNGRCSPSIQTLVNARRGPTLDLPEFLKSRRVTANGNGSVRSCQNSLKS